MKKNEAIIECNRWLDHLKSQKEKSVKMQKLAALARTGPDGQKEAKKLMDNITRQITVYDGAKLEMAVRTLLAAMQ